MDEAGGISTTQKHFSNYFYLVLIKISSNIFLKKNLDFHRFPDFEKKVITVAK